MSSVEINSVGPISSITFDLPTGEGGVKILRGTSGVGKTTALKVLSGLIGDSNALAGLNPKEGCEQGTVKGLGRSVKIGAKQNRTAGSSSVPTLSGLDVSILVDPKVAKAESRLAERVRCLVSIGGKQVTPEDLLGDKFGEFAELIDIDESRRFKDPVAMADYLKRALDKAALEVERQSDRKSGESEAKRREAGDIDSLNDSLSYEDAVAAHRVAMQSVSDAKQKQWTYRTGISANEGFKEQLTELQTKQAKSLDDLRADIVAHEKSVEGLRARLEVAKSNLEASKLALRNAEQNERSIERIKGYIVDVGDDVPDSTVFELESKEQEALERLNAASSIATRKKALEESIKIQNESADLASKALQLRSAAQSVQAEVQKALPSGPIRVKDGNLVIQKTNRSKPVPIDELSTGERWRVALEYAISAVGTGGVFPIEQEAWQSLGPELKAEIAEQCREAKVWMITGEVGEGELHMDEYVPAELADVGQ